MVIEHAVVDFGERITSDPRIMVGKPVVKGTRIPVELVLKRLAQDPDVDTLFEAYPHLTRADVQACLRYAQALVEGAEVSPRPKHITEHAAVR